MKNKKHITRALAILLFIGLSTACKQKKQDKTVASEATNNATITGNISGSISAKTISLIEINNSLEDETVSIINTVDLDKGAFSFKNLNVDDPRAVKLTFGDSIHSIVFLEPGVTNVQVFPQDTVFTEQFPGVEVRAKRTGTINNELFTKYRDKRHAVLKDPEFIEVRALDKTMFDMYADMDLLNQQFSDFRKLSSKRDALLRTIKTDFIRENNNKMVSPYILLYEDFSFDDFFEAKQIVDFFDGYDKKLEGNRYYERVKKYVTSSRNTAIGMTLKDFTLKNRNGDSVTLSSFKGKYVLIDFWAYWCKPCIASFPHLEKLRKKYKADGFEILGISSDPNHEKWIKALDKHKPSWTQVIDDKDKTVSKLFNIAQLPTTFLVDKEGKVFAIDLNAEDLDYELAAIFGH